MRKLALIFSLIAALALPATSVAHDGQGHKTGSKGCQVVASKKGGKCLSKKAKLMAKRAAVRACREERAEDVAAFRAKYGDVVTSENGESKPRHAFRNCVKQNVQETIAEFKNAAKECAAELLADTDAFFDKYGTNHNKRNAFGKCVSSHVQAENGPDDEDVTPGPQGEEHGLGPGENGNKDEHVPDHAADNGPDQG
jgi:hypothetical protein